MSLGIIKIIIKKIFYINIHTEHLYHLIILRFFPSKVLDYSGHKDEINPDDYYNIYRSNLNNSYPVIDNVERKLGFKIDNEWLNNLALITQISIKKTKICYVHGRVLYSYLRYLISHNQEKYFNILEVGTSKGFSSLCMAKSLEDSKKNGKIITIDILAHDKEIYWNSISDCEGRKTRKDLLKNWKPLMDKYISYLCGESNKVLKKLNLERINFAFLDGSHTYYDLKSEFEFTAKRQYKSDIIVIDDYDDQYKGLKKAADKCCKAFNYNKTLIKADINRTYLICQKN